MTPRAALYNGDSKGAIAPIAALLQKRSKQNEREKKMALKISASKIAKMRSHYEGLARKASGMRAKGESVVGEIVQAAEISASAFAFGAVQGRYGPVSVVGIPVDLGAAAVLHLAGFVGLAGKASEHLHAFADGALASYFFTLGRGVGSDLKLKASGAKTAVSGEGLTDEDLARLSGRKAA